VNANVGPLSPRWLAAWGVHAFTASGAVAALAALRAGWQGDLSAAFLWLSLALAIDACDGTLARLVDVKRVLPHMNGSHLDDLVDYQTFVLVPIALLLEHGTLRGTSGGVAAGAALIASACRFSTASAKTPDHLFTGFPSYWNILALYLVVFDVTPTVAAAITFGLACLVPAPLRFIYPSRTEFLMGWSVGLGLVWAAVMLDVIWQLPTRATTLATLSLFYPVYYTVASLTLQARQALGEKPLEELP
jgi:phosphatidylcholine synthase